MGIPLSAIRFEPEVVDDVRATKLAADEVIDLTSLPVRVRHTTRIVISRITMARERFFFHRRRDVTLVLSPFRRSDNLFRQADT